MPDRPEALQEPIGGSCKPYREADIDFHCRQHRPPVKGCRQPTAESARARRVETPPSRIRCPVEDDPEHGGALDGLVAQHRPVAPCDKVRPGPRTAARAHDAVRQEIGLAEHEHDHVTQPRFVRSASKADPRSRWEGGAHARSRRRALKHPVALPQHAGEAGRLVGSHDVPPPGVFDGTPIQYWLRRPRRRGRIVHHLFVEVGADGGAAQGDRVSRDGRVRNGALCAEPETAMRLGRPHVLGAVSMRVARRWSSQG
jgi:hypothetical protein